MTLGAVSHSKLQVPIARADVFPGQESLDKPEIAVEFKLLYGRRGEPLTFDFIKLLDKRNPFKKVVSAAVVLRPNLNQDQVYADLINAAYNEALTRLGNQYLDPDRIQRFILTVIAKGGRSHWYNANVRGTYQRTNATPLLPE